MRQVFLKFGKDVRVPYGNKSISLKSPSFAKPNKPTYGNAPYPFTRIDRLANATARSLKVFASECYELLL